MLLEIRGSGKGKKSFALAVNSEVIKKENFESFIILPNSKIEIISAVGGG